MNASIIKATRDFKTCVNLDSFKISLINDNVLMWNIIFSPNTEIYNKSYVFRLVINDNYPFESPSLMCETRIFHPNIDFSSGKICLPRLANWTAKYNIQMLLMDLIDLFKNPDLSSPVNLQAVELWNHKEKFIERMKMMIEEN